eukprot:m.328323 g.328323  ORF g.328323 m.328323 type:complete len:410 (-) comp16033_c0_seq2:1238-2467(-)
MHTSPTYASLISVAILAAPDQRLVLEDIYSFIERHQHLLPTNSKGWRNSVRHNLSLRKCFAKSERKSSTGRAMSAWWLCDTEHLPKTAKEYVAKLFSLRQRNPDATADQVFEGIDLSDCTPATPCSPTHAVPPMPKLAKPNTTCSRKVAERLSAVPSFYSQAVPSSGSHQPQAPAVPRRTTASAFKQTNQPVLCPQRLTQHQFNSAIGPLAAIRSAVMQRYVNFTNFTANKGHRSMQNTSPPADVPSTTPVPQFTGDNSASCSPTSLSAPFGFLDSQETDFAQLLAQASSSSTGAISTVASTAAVSSAAPTTTLQPDRFNQMVFGDMAPQPSPPALTPTSYDKPIISLKDDMVLPPVFTTTQPLYAFNDSDPEYNTAQSLPALDIQLEFGNSTQWGGDSLLSTDDFYLN